MIPVSKEVATKIILDGIQKGFSSGFINNNKNTEYSVYIREYDNFTFKIAEDENKNEYFALEDTDTFDPTHNFEKLRETIKEGPEILSEVVKLLEEANRIDMKEYAIELMKLLKLHPNVIKEFKKENKLNRSETNLGLLYWLNEYEEKIVQKFEQENPDKMVYHLIKTHTKDFGIVYNLLYVTANPEEFEQAKIDLKDNLVLAYVTTEYKECGLIQIKSINGGLVRTY